MHTHPATACPRATPRQRTHIRILACRLWHSEASKRATPMQRHYTGGVLSASLDQVERVELKG